MSGHGPDRDGPVVVFDLDGCILDSTEPITRCLDAALVDHGLAPRGRDDLAPRIGPPLQHMVEGILAEAGADPGLRDRVVDSYRDRYRTASIELALLYPGVAEVLAQLGGSIRLAVCTSKPERYAVPILEHLGLAPSFDVIAGPLHGEAEPKTETLRRALGALDPVDRPGSLMVGDRSHDVEAALAHGLVPVGVTWGFGTADELWEAGAVHVVDTPAEVAALAGTLRR